MDCVYQAISVERQEIRIISLAPGSWADDIRCALTTVSLKDSPEYVALSYVWGDANHKSPISVNGQRFDVTYNLRTALRRLRDPDAVRYVWADAVCINQQDLKERGQQVSLMGEVYSKCKECFIWLGEEDDAPFEYKHVPNMREVHSDQTVATFERYLESNNIRSVPGLPATGGDLNGTPGQFNFDFTAALSIFQMLAAGKHFYEMPFYRLTTFPHFDLDDTWNNARRSLINILGRPWFSRTWTVQEAVLPPKATFGLGEHLVDLQVLLDAQSNFGLHLFDRQCCVNICGKLWETRDGEKSMYNAFGPLGDLRQMQTYNRHRDSQSNASLMTQHYFLSSKRSCTDPLDAIYGFLGVLPSQLYESVHPDYSTTTASLYARVTKHLFSAQTSLKLLGWVSDSSHRPYKIPSWCLDWNEEVIPYLSIMKYEACAEFKYYVPPATDPGVSIMQLEGFHVSTVSAVGIPVENVNDLWLVAALKRTVESWSSLGRTERGPTDDFWRAAFMDKPVINTNEKREKEVNRMQTDDLEAVKVWWKWVLTLDETTRIDEIWPLPSNDLADCQTTLLAAHARSNFFVTADGGFGCAPSGIKPGDQIFIVRGCRAPLVLREQVDASESVKMGASYLFVGCCYLHGIMNGEAIKNEPDWSTLLLR